MRSAADQALRIKAEQTYGVFDRLEALEAGHTARTIGYRLNKGTWHSLHPTVYCWAGAPPTWEGRLLAACKWMKGQAAGRAAGRLFGLPGCDLDLIEVVTSTKNVIPHGGAVVHRTLRLPQEQVTIVKGIPCTTIERTLMDLCGLWRDRRAPIALDAALRRGLTTLGSLDRCLFLTARRGRRGSGRLRKLMQERAQVAVLPESPLESVILDLIRAAELPLPRAQVPIFDDRRVFIARPDFLYESEKVIVQGHSKMWHWGRYAEAKDLAQHNQLTRLGYRILYVTWADATQNAEVVASNLRELLKAAA